MNSGSRMSIACALWELVYGHILNGSGTESGIENVLVRAVGFVMDMRSLCDSSSSGLGNSTLSALALSAMSKAFSATKDMEGMLAQNRGSEGMLAQNRGS